MSEIFLDRLTHRVFGKYKVLERLGKGGMSFVYKGLHLELGLPVAIKFPFLRFAQNAENRQRFLREARVQFHLKHNNLVRVIDLIDQEDVLGMVMDWIEGSDLERYLDKKGFLSFEEIARLFLPVLDVVEYAHRKDIIHRDLKPGNILLEATYDGYVPKVMDFGIAKFASPENPARSGLDITQTAANTVIGTPAYFSPEQATGQKVDHRTDIYSLGIVFFQMLTGRLPFVGENLLDMIFAHYNNPIPSVTSLRPELHSRFQDILERALAKKPEARYPDCASFARDLRESLSVIAPHLFLDPNYTPSGSLPIFPSENYRGTTPEMSGISLQHAESYGPLPSSAEIVAIPKPSFLLSPPAPAPSSLASLPASPLPSPLASSSPSSPSSPSFSSSLSPLPSGSVVARSSTTRLSWPATVALLLSAVAFGVLSYVLLPFGSTPPPAALPPLLARPAPPSSPPSSASPPLLARSTPPPLPPLAAPPPVSPQPPTPPVSPQPPTPPVSPQPPNPPVSPQPPNPPVSPPVARSSSSHRQKRLVSPSRPKPPRRATLKAVEGRASSLEPAGCKRCVVQIQTKITMNLQIEDLTARKLCTIDGLITAAEVCSKDCGGDRSSFQRAWLSLRFQDAEGYERPASALPTCKRLLQTKAFLERIRPLYSP